MESIFLADAFINSMNYLPFFSLFKVQEHGILSVERSRRYSDRPGCSSHAANFESVGITECYAGFLVLCYGIAAALVLFCAEFICKTKCYCFKKYHQTGEH